MKFTAIGPIVLATLLLLCSYAAAADVDVFILSGGGRVMGQLLNPDQKPRTTFVVQTAAGKLTLDASRVKQRLRKRAEELEYERVRPGFPDTVEGQWALSEWCREKNLVTQRSTHLERIIELEPNHEQARRGLGHSQVNGRWTTQKEEMARTGYRLYKGRYRTSQQIELMEKDKKQDLAEKEWFKKLKRWRGWLGSDKSNQARNSILDIDNPVAVKALAFAMEDDKRQPVRILLAEALANVGTPTALAVLADRSLEDPIEEVRLSCLDYLKDTKDPTVLAFFVGKLRSKDNGTVNRAAVALSYVNNPSAIGPLVDALVTIHKFKINKGKQGQMSNTFSNSGAGGMSMGSSTKIVKIPFKNRAVLDTLVVLSGGVNFNFDTQAWKYWYTSSKNRKDLDARRD